VRTKLGVVANEALVSSIKGIIARAKNGDADGAYDGYRELFASPEFAGYRVEDQRQALQLMVLMKGAPKPPTPAMIKAHSAARHLLVTLVKAHSEPSDHEMLGICHVLLGDEASASEVFRAGLAIERLRDPQYKMCGSLMKRVSMV